MANTKFINVSNHPSTIWSEKQIKAAKKYGSEIIDVPFPNVPPTATKLDVINLAANLIEQIKNVANGEPYILHIMGELTLTHIVVKYMYNNTFTCLASTTERIVTENADGTKNSKFEFVRFREY